MAEVIEAPLTASDRCDRCGARAAIWVRFNSGPLCFCAHHGREHGFLVELERVGG